MKRILLGSLAGMVVLTAWGMLFWGVLYESAGLFGDLPEQAEVAKILQENDTHSGTYFYPWPRKSPEAAKVWLEKHKAGPFFKLSYVQEGVDPQSPGKLIFGTAHLFAVSLLGALLVWLALPGLNTFPKRAGAVFVAGLMGTLFIQLGDPIWFHLPWKHALGNAVYEGVAWVLLGFVLGGIIRSHPG